jgi:hypothetical protein
VVENGAVTERADDSFGEYTGLSTGWLHGGGGHVAS